MAKPESTFDSQLSSCIGCKLDGHLSTPFGPTFPLTKLATPTHQQPTLMKVNFSIVARWQKRSCVICKRVGSWKDPRPSGRGPALGSSAAQVGSPLPSLTQCERSMNTFRECPVRCHVNYARHGQRKTFGRCESRFARNYLRCPTRLDEYPPPQGAAEVSKPRGSGSLKKRHGLLTKRPSKVPLLDLAAYLQRPRSHCQRHE